VVGGSGGLRIGEPGRTAELFQVAASGVPVHRHERQDEVGLFELDALGVDPDEDVGDLLLRGVRGELQCRERVVTQVVKPVDRLDDLIFLVVAQLSTRAQAFDELGLEPVPRLRTGSQLRHIADELGILVRRGVGHGEPLVPRFEGDREVDLPVLVVDDRSVLDHRVQ
jgi:hypothetical protein